VRHCRGGGIHFDSVARAAFSIAQIRTQVAHRSAEVEHRRAARNQAGNCRERILAFQLAGSMAMRKAVLQAGPVLGYGWTRGRLYFGGEIDAARSWQDNAKVHTEGINGVAHFRNSAAASGLLGLLFDDDVLLYGRAGIEYLDEKDEFGTEPQSRMYSRGFSVGGGMEFKLWENIHLRGEFTYANLDALRTEVARGRLSVLYRFSLF